MGNQVPDRGQGRAVTDWQSPWPKGHANRTEYVSPAQQTANMNKKKPEYRTEPDRTSQEMPSKNTPIITKTAYKEKHGWVSAWPSGHPNHSPVVTAKEQTQNARRANRNK